MSVIHANEFAEVTAYGQGRRPHELYLRPDWIAFVRRGVAQSMCFYVGDVFAIQDRLEPIEELVRLPYPHCWFDLRVEHYVMGVHAHEDGDGTLFMSCFMRIRAGHWNVLGHIVLSQGSRIQSRSTEDDKELLYLAALPTMAFLSALNCTNVKRVEHKPSEKLQKARRKRGKQPLFSYWTLELDLSSSAGERTNLGGTHASPRVHLRRGHPRQYAPGKWTWVQPHAVGNKSLGIVHKDYVVRKDKP